MFRLNVKIEKSVLAQQLEQKLGNIFISYLEKIY